MYNKKQLLVFNLFYVLLYFQVHLGVCDKYNRFFSDTEAELKSLMSEGKSHYAQLKAKRQEFDRVKKNYLSLWYEIAS